MASLSSSQRVFGSGKVRVQDKLLLGFDCKHGVRNLPLHWSSLTLLPMISIQNARLKGANQLLC